MANIKFEIDDYFDLLNLHKALLEAKFHENPDNEYVAGSPIIAKICNDIINALSDYEIKERGESDWDEWRKLRNHSDVRMKVINWSKKIEKWEMLSEELKIEKIRNYISPFDCSTDEILEIIKMM